jgi:hypothetical protein
MGSGKSQKLSEITNTPQTKKRVTMPVENAYVVPDNDILDLKLEVSEDELFSNLSLDFSDLVFVKKNKI